MSIFASFLLITFVGLVIALILYAICLMIYPFIYPNEEIITYYIFTKEQLKDYCKNYCKNTGK